MAMFKDALFVAENKKTNRGVPEEMRDRFKVDIAELKGIDLVIDMICVISRRAMKNGEAVLNKAGDNIYKHITFIGFGDDKFTVTSSELMALQLNEIEPCVKDEDATIWIPALKGANIRISSKPVQYADKKTYDNYYIEDA